VLEDVVDGEPFMERLLLSPTHSDSELNALLQSVCNDLRAPNDYALQKRLFESVRAQIQKQRDIDANYAQTLAKMQRQNAKEREILSESERENGNGTECHGHVVLRLSVSHGKLRLRHECVWNLNDAANALEIEPFAAALVSEQGLPPKFGCSVAHAMRTQIAQQKVRLTRAMNARLRQKQRPSMNGRRAKALMELNDPLRHEALRFVGRKRQSELRDLRRWQPEILVHRPHNRMKTKLRD